jgi:hypothetical protein
MMQVEQPDIRIVGHANALKQFKPAILLSHHWHNLFYDGF